LTNRSTGELHADFGDLHVDPGEIVGATRPELFDIVNLVAFGGAADQKTHVPKEIGRIGPVVFWESTGAADALPFWNTNLFTDIYLYIVHGGARVVLKAVDSDEVYGEYVARTGDLFRLPKDVAHRTYSLDGKRRITMEILERDPAWDTIGALAHVQPAATTTLGGFRFEADGDVVRVTAGERTTEEPRGFFVRGLRALVAWELHLGHNEFEGGFVVRDDGDDTVWLRLGDHAESFPPADVQALFLRLLADLGSD
jgi:hypothetical protein